MSFLNTLFIIFFYRYRLDVTVSSPIDTVVDKLITLGRRVNWDPDVEEHVIEDIGDVR